MADSSYRVMKFGGTSLGSPDRLHRVIEIIGNAVSEGPVAVVVSAMEHTTDRLIEAADLAARGDHAEAERIMDQMSDLITANSLVVLDKLGRSAGNGGSTEVTQTIRELMSQCRQLLVGVHLLRELTDQTRDLVMSFGEQLSARLLAQLLNARGVKSEYVDSRQWMVTDDHFGRARVETEATRDLLSDVAQRWNDTVPVVTGFLGRTKDGRTTTLGRNGSDYTATLLAQNLGACEVVIWTDVSGVMTADPAIVKDAYPLSRMSYMEALELVDFGASMFHASTMIPLIDSRIPMRIRNTMHPEDPGTLVDVSGSANSNYATCVTSLENLALLGVQMHRITKRAHIAGKVMKALDDAGVTIFMANQSAHGQSVAVTVPVSEVEESRSVIHEALAIEIERGEMEEVTVLQPVTLLSLVAEAMGHDVNVAGRFYQALGAVGVNIRAAAQGSSSRSISCVIDAPDTRVAVRTVHAAFNLAHQEVCLLVLGKGTVGSELLGQIRAEGRHLEKEHDVRLKVVGLVGSRGALFDEGGIDLDSWEDRIRKVEGGDNGEEADLPVLMEKMRRLPVPILVDCTAAEGMEETYQAAFEQGIHVVGANKKPLTISWDGREHLMNEARRHHRSYEFETTVGAALPVIETLKNLVRTGDQVQLIEGSFSGTLGYIANELMSGVPLSVATRTAWELGYTEPNPKEDLSGMDVARKALILARELGLELGLDDLHVEPFAPAELLAEDLEPEAFLEALERFDGASSKEIERLKADGKILRYMARVDPAGGPSGDRPAVSVGRVGVGHDHPSSLLGGTEAFVAFTTERYQDTPLIVQGAGAGGPVTASGVLSDILKISMTLRGR